jgi:cysteine-rich repeat protein
MKRLAILALLATGGVAASVMEAAAWVCCNSEFGGFYGPGRWPGGAVRWVYNPVPGAGAPQPMNLPGGAGAAATIAAVTNAALTWNNDAGSEVNFARHATNGSEDANGNGMLDAGEDLDADGVLDAGLRCVTTGDGINTAGWENFAAVPLLAGSARAHAVTLRRYMGGTIVEADLCFNTAPNWAQLDLQTVAVHEWGHALNLDHANHPEFAMIGANGTRPGPEYAKAVMYAWINFATPAVIKRNLVCDDKGGANYLYPLLVPPVMETRDYLTQVTGGCDFGDALDPFTAIGLYPSLENGEDDNNNGILEGPEDANGNGMLDPGEDRNASLGLDPGEDRNGNAALDRSHGGRHKDSRMEWLGPIALGREQNVTMPTLFGQTPVLIPKNAVIPAPPPNVIAAQTGPLSAPTAVARLDGDAGLLLVNFAAAERFVDTDGSGAYGAGERIYNDADGSGAVSVNDRRLLIFGAGFLAAVVAAGSGDIGLPLSRFPATQRHTDPNGDGAYQANEVIYTDADRSRTVTAGDMRLGSAGPRPASATFEPETRQVNADELDDGVSFRAPIAPGQPVVVDVFVNTNGLAPGRYARNAAQQLYLSGWEDWNRDGDWKDWAAPRAGGAVAGAPPCIPPDPSDEYVLWWTGFPPGNNVQFSPNFCGSTPLGRGMILTFVITPPLPPANPSPGASAPPPRLSLESFYGRFRLDYGEDVGVNARPYTDPTLAPPNLLSGVNGRGYDQGEAKYGEVEDYLQPVEVDFFPKSKAEADIRVPAGSPVPNIVELKGPTTVQVKLGDLQDTDGDGLEQIPTEIVQMELTGTSPFGRVKVTIRDAGKDPFQRSTGEIEEGANDNPGILDLPPFIDDGPGVQGAGSFFDVFFEIELSDLGVTLHNRDPKRMTTEITHKPPAEGETYENPEFIPLFDENGTLIAEIGPGFHVPNPVPVSQTKDQQKCINALNKDGIKVAGAQGKENASCVSAAVKGTTTDPDACLTADEKRKVGKAADKSTRDQAARCGGNAVPDFGADDARRVNASAQNGELALLSDLFGSSLVDVISTDRAVGNCQVTVVRGYERIVAAKLKQFVGCKKQALAAGVSGAADLRQQCVTAGGIGADATGKIAKAVARLGTDIQKKCAGVDASVACGAGVCAGGTGSACVACIDRAVECRVCLMLRGMDGLDIDCDAFDDGASNGSCPPGAPVCGNGVVESPEECDDGNASSADPCLGDCTSARCGDDFVCSDPACATGPNGGPEQCDDGGTTPGDGCGAVCEVEVPEERCFLLIDLEVVLRARDREDGVLEVDEPSSGHQGIIAPPEPTACPCLHYHGLLFGQPDPAPAFCGWGCVEEIPCPIVVDAAGSQ